MTDAKQNKTEEEKAKEKVEKSPLLQFITKKKDDDIKAYSTQPAEH